MSNRTRKWILAGTIALLAIMLLACIKVGGKEPEVTPVPPTATPLPPTATPVPPTATPAPEAKPEIVGVSLCRGLTDDQRPFAETNTFSEIDPFVLSIQVVNMKAENVVAARWYQADTFVGLTERDSIVGDTFVGLSLEPQGRWTPGDYSVEVNLDGHVIESRDFVVISAVSLPPPGKGKGDGGGGDAGQFSSYTNEGLGFSIDHPQDWLVKEGDSGVQFAHPQDTALVLVTINADPAANAEQEAEAIYDKLSQNLSNAQKQDSKSQDDGWHSILFKYDNNGVDIVGILFSQVTASRGYSVIIVVVQDQWENVVSTLEHMWASFEITSGDPGGDGGDDEVLIVGTVRDSDTKRGIPNALFVVLKEGVTVKEFLDSGNDKSLIYDTAQSDAEGNFKMNVGVKRGTTYHVFAVAKGYTPVVDKMLVPQDSDDPWQITVTMQKE